MELLWPPPSQLRLGMEASTYDKVEPYDESLFLYKAIVCESSFCSCGSALFFFLTTGH